VAVRTAPKPGIPQSCSSRRRQELPRAFLDLGAVRTAPGCARAWTREILREWGAAELTADAELVVSELVTNSVNACVGLDRAAITLILTLDQGELAVLVRDNHPGVPVAVQPGPQDEGGRGLLIVEYFSDRCGWCPLENGKMTWAVISGSRRGDSEPPAGQHPGGLPDASMADGARLGPVLPVRRRQAVLLTTGIRAPRLIDAEILARVKVVLELR
jgi:anti-sigma regulatory factor (Ser/Thr protein kinase)